MEYVIHAVHRILDRGKIAHIADIEFDLPRDLRHLRLKIVTHIVLLFLVARENADLADIGLEKTVQDRITERAGASRDHQGLSGKK